LCNTNCIARVICFLLGSEFSGDILEVGREVSGLSVGDVVAGLAKTDALQEILTLPSSMLEIVSSPFWSIIGQRSIISESYGIYCI